MRVGTIFLALVLAVAVVAIVHWREPGIVAETSPKKFSSALDVSPVCPWRDPRHDLHALFPAATNHLLETRILSGSTVEIVKRLGRQMNPDENPLRIHRAMGEEGTLGSVLVTRVKGEHGGIEIVIGVNSDGAVKGVLIQSQREPEEVAKENTSPTFLNAFAGKSSLSRLSVGDDLPKVSDVARNSAQAIADGVRSQLIVFSFAERSTQVGTSATHTNH